MLIQKTFAAILINILLFGNVIAQQNAVTEMNQSEISSELKQQAVEFLRQTIKEIPNLKAEENRQYFTIETARLLRQYDEKESRRMLEQVMAELKKQIAKVNGEYQNELEKAKRSNLVIAANAANTNTSDESDEYPIARYQFEKILRLRRSLITNLIRTDPLLAYTFLTETSQMIPNNRYIYIYGEMYDALENKVVTALLAKDETDKSIELARKMLDKEFSEAFLMTLKMIYEKDAVKGNQLAEETVQKINTTKIKGTGSYNELSTFFDRAIESNKQKQPLLGDKSLRELAQLLGQKVLSEMDRDYYYFTPFDYAKKIQKYAPRESLKILQKAKQKRIPTPKYYASNTAANAANAAANAAMAAARAAANAAVKEAANKATPAKKSKAKQTTPKVEVPPTKTASQQKQDTKEDLYKKLANGKFTAEERKEIIKKAKDYAFTGKSWGYYIPDGFFLVVSELAMFSLLSADKEVADELMKEAEVYIRPENKHFADYAGKFMLAIGYSSHQPDKSFALMESLASINEVIESAVKVGSFIDIEESFVPGGEISAVQFLARPGFFGFVRGITPNGELQFFIQNLAKADFKRTTALANKFERTEVKMTAKMLILESLIGTPFEQAEPEF